MQNHHENHHKPVEAAPVTDSAPATVVENTQSARRELRVGDRVYWWEMRSGPQAVRPLPAEPYFADVTSVRPPQGDETEPRANLFVAKEGLWIIVTDKARADIPTHGYWCWRD